MFNSVIREIINRIQYLIKFIFDFFIPLTRFQFEHVMRMGKYKTLL